MPAIAIVGMACTYPDANSPAELWENVLAQRRAFRRMPPERLRLQDYYSPDEGTPDSTYATNAALIEGYEFDRVGYRVGGSTFRSADLAHWLALDVASRALDDAGFGGGEGLPRDTTGVLLGNTLTGEFSRANGLRLRWPYVRRVVESALIDDGMTPEQRRSFIDDLEARYKDPFPPVDEETLAGGLSNTIAGRICNYFNLRGGGYTLDGACASSLLAVANACSGLVTRDLDVALAGGVDLSLDPFELVGFAKTAALAHDEMRVYDVRSEGFWPGEGCGVLVLMRHEDAVVEGRRVYAVIRGWGVSSDGSGGITRPEVDGQILALQRAYRRASVGIDKVPYFEGHGTGTSVGDATELVTLSRARREADPDAPPAAIGSIKANSGHTKAAAGIAGMIKATMALQSRVLPPTTGCENPHEELTVGSPALRVLDEGEPWPDDRALQAGVSAMGFGGINTHVVLEGADSDRPTKLTPGVRSLVTSEQDAELFLMGADGVAGLKRQLEHLATIAPRLSFAEMGDLAAQMQRALDEPNRVRVAVVASRPEELAGNLDTLRSWLAAGETARLDTVAGAFLGMGAEAPSIGVLFPGQGAPARLGGGALRRRFEFARELYPQNGQHPYDDDAVATDVAQPAIVTASLAALRLLSALGIEGSVAIGHSLGEITALYWAGAMDEATLRRIAAARGKTMAELGSSHGAMAGIGAGPREVAEFLNGDAVALAAMNSPAQTVISGKATEVDKLVSSVQTRGLRAVKLPVSHAFHSPLVADAAPALARHLAHEELRPVSRTVVSTVTGAPLDESEDLKELLCRQVTSPVRFTEAVACVADDVDLWIEAGPGQTLTRLMADFDSAPAVALDAGGPSLRGTLQAAGAAFALGAPVDHSALFAGRFTRPFDLDWRPRFFANPTEQAPVHDAEALPQGTASPTTDEAPAEAPAVQDGPSYALSKKEPLELLRRLVAEWSELPLSAVKDDSNLLTDLHMNSIAVGEIVAEASRRLGLAAPVAPTDYAVASVGEVARALADLARTGGPMAASNDERVPPGVDSWVRTFSVEMVERAIRPREPANGAGDWRVIAPPGHPLADPLRQALGDAGKGGVVVCLPPEPDERDISLLLEGARAALASREEVCFVLVQHGGGAGAFARTLHLEAPQVATCVVDVPVEHPKAAEWVIAEAMAAAGYTEAHYDLSGRRREPVLRVLPPQGDSAELPLGAADLMLVTGGGKGIAAECALSLAKETGVRLALIGRSHPSEDAELATNLERMAAAGVEYQYVSADVTDADAVHAAVQGIEEIHGPVTAVLHGAGANEPRLIDALDEETFLSTVAPKVRGARNVLAAVDPDRLRLLVTFGSIIARTGMRGEADYALANEWLSRETERFQAGHPECRCSAVEWSVWSGVGMGERLGRVDALARQGITAITPDEGISVLRSLIAQPPSDVSVVVTGRFGEAPTLSSDTPDLPFLRFLERPRVHYPGVELVVDTELSADTDRYLDDHVFQGERLLPAVIGREAMAQVAMALTRSAEPPAFEDLRFLRPVVVPDGTRVTLRLAALVRKPGLVEVVLRSDRTAFQVDHVRATCRFEPRETATAGGPALLQRPAVEAAVLPVDPERDLYGGILFQSGRFQRLRAYRWLRSTECVAEIGPDGAGDWFVPYLPGQLVLGDPGARDAAIHAVQACIPHVTVLPTGADRVVIDSAGTPGARFVRARERARDGGTFVYDLEVTDADGLVRERWEGLKLRTVASTSGERTWAEPLLGTYAERRVAELIPGADVAIQTLLNGNGDRRFRSARAMQRMLGEKSVIQKRPDGKPEVSGNGRLEVSVSHAGDLTLAVSGRGPIGCDVEPVTPRAESVWQDLLGRERFGLAQVVAEEAAENHDAAATRVWAALESLKKAGAMMDAPLVLESAAEDGWVTLTAGPFTLATLVARVRSSREPLALAVAVKPDASL